MGGRARRRLQEMPCRGDASWRASAPRPSLNRLQDATAQREQEQPGRYEKVDETETYPRNSVVRHALVRTAVDAPAKRADGIAMIAHM